MEEKQQLELSKNTKILYNLIQINILDLSHSLQISGHKYGINQIKQSLEKQYNIFGQTQDIFQELKLKKLFEIMKLISQNYLSISSILLDHLHKAIKGQQIPMDQLTQLTQRRIDQFSKSIKSLKNTQKHIQKQKFQKINTIINTPLNNMEKEASKNKNQSQIQCSQKNSFSNDIQYEQAQQQKKINLNKKLKLNKFGGITIYNESHQRGIQYKQIFRSNIFNKRNKKINHKQLLRQLIMKQLNQQTDVQKLTGDDQIAKFIKQSKKKQDLYYHIQYEKDLQSISLFLKQSQDQASQFLSQSKKVKAGNNDQNLIINYHQLMQSLAFKKKQDFTNVQNKLKQVIEKLKFQSNFLQDQLYKRQYQIKELEKKLQKKQKQKKQVSVQTNNKGKHKSMQEEHTQILQENHKIIVQTLRKNIQENQKELLTMTTQIKIIQQKSKKKQIQAIKFIKEIQHLRKSLRQQKQKSNIAQSMSKQHLKQDYINQSKDKAYKLDEQNEEQLQKQNNQNGHKKKKSRASIVGGNLGNKNQPIKSQILPANQKILNENNNVSRNNLNQQNNKYSAYKSQHDSGKYNSHSKFSKSKLKNFISLKPSSDLHLQQDQIQDKDTDINQKRNQKKLQTQNNSNISLQRKIYNNRMIQLNNHDQIDFQNKFNRTKNSILLEKNADYLYLYLFNTEEQNQKQSNNDRQEQVQFIKKFISKFDQVKLGQKVNKLKNFMQMSGLGFIKQQQTSSQILRSSNQAQHKRQTFKSKKNNKNFKNQKNKIQQNNQNNLFEFNQNQQNEQNDQNNETNQNQNNLQEQEQKKFPLNFFNKLYKQLHSPENSYNSKKSFIEICQRVNLSNWDSQGQIKQNQTLQHINMNSNQINTYKNKQSIFFSDKFIQDLQEKIKNLKHLTPQQQKIIKQAYRITHFGSNEKGKKIKKGIDYSNNDQDLTTQKSLIQRERKNQISSFINKQLGRSKYQKDFLQKEQQKMAINQIQKLLIKKNKGNQAYLFINEILNDHSLSLTNILQIKQILLKLRDEQLDNLLKKDCQNHNHSNKQQNHQLDGCCSHINKYKKFIQKIINDSKSGKNKKQLIGLNVFNIDGRGSQNQQNLTYSSVNKKVTIMQVNNKNQRKSIHQLTTNNLSAVKSRNQNQNKTKLKKQTVSVYIQNKNKKNQPYFPQLNRKSIRY